MNPQTAQKTSKSVSWLFWYTWIILGLSALVARNDPVTMIYLAVGNWLLWLLPTWIIVKTVRYFRSNQPIPEPPRNLEDNEPDDGILPNMTRKTNP